MAACILCLQNKWPAEQQIELFSDEGLRLNVCGIISKHFWLRPSSVMCSGERICLACWEAVRDFHEFYVRVAEAHKHFDSKEVFLTLDSEVDPLPHEVQLKSEEVSSAGKLVEALGETFFDSEVKVEVHDLDLLPQIEIIEEGDNMSGRAQRAQRRCQQSRDPPTTHTKRIKCENTTHVGPGCDARTDVDDSEPELPLAVLVKTDFSEDLLSSCISDERDMISTTAGPQKRRRGRPKKVKAEEEPSTATATARTTPTTPLTSTTPSHAAATIKAETTGSDSEDPSQHTAELGSGTDDSASSSSHESDSDESWAEPEPIERYAEIPKRVVVKPKKYRKRPKPLVPPRRMTREEIDRKNAQQAEYDKAIAQFFDKMACPKCCLLVQNFGDMRRHYRAAHNEEPGYIMCCGRKFHQRKALAEHVYVHWNPEHFKCATCSRVFQDGRALEVHESSHANPPTDPKDKKVFQCDKCPKGFTTKAAFEYHAFSKHVPKSEFKFTCPECNKKLPTERKLKDHLKYMHDPESAIICDKCGKQVRSQSNLKKHHEIEHSDVPRPTPVPMQCEICGTWLRHLSGLKQHMKTIHEDTGGEHRCHICNKTSTNARALKRHIYHNHECERKFKCTMCEKAFKRPQDLREHTSTHTGEVLYTCPNCPMTFFSNANMYKHRQRLHRAEWEADKKKPVPPNIMQQAVGATAAMKMQQAVGATSAFFAHKHTSAHLPPPQPPPPPPTSAHT